MNNGMAHDMSDGTRAAMLTFGQRLARDIAPIQARSMVELTSEEEVFLRRAKEVLAALDQLDVGLDEHADRAVERLRRAPGEEWLIIAEGGDPALRGYVAHVVHFFDRPGGYPGGRFVTRILEAIDAADENSRDALAVACPEYVGLWRAAAHIPGAVERLAAIQWR